MAAVEHQVQKEIENTGATTSVSISDSETKSELHALSYRNQVCTQVKNSKLRSTL